MRAPVPLLALPLVLVACGPQATDGPPVAAPDHKADQPMVPSPLDGGSTSDAAGCSASATLVYVVDLDNVLFSFRPDTLVFTQIGTLACPAQPGATPFSMSVDRSATAWVVYDSGELFRVSTVNAACQATSFQPGQQGFSTFGMGFSANAAGSADETLYIAGGDYTQGFPTSSPLGTIAFPSLAVASRGTVSGSPELTGTGDGKLWGFFPNDATTPDVALIDKSTGASTTSFPLPSLLGVPTAWAFAFWGGDFWLFLQRDTDPSTSVYRVNGTTGAMQTVLSNTGRVIVGAGVSTCAPLTVL